MVTLFESKNGKKVAFSGWRDFAAWVSTQKSNWGWLVSSGADQNIYTQMNQNWNILSNIIQTNENQGLSFDQYGKNLWDQHAPSLITDYDNAFEKISNIRKAHGDEVAAYADGYLSKTFNINLFGQTAALKGALFTVAPDAATIGTAIDALAAEREKYRSDLERLIQNFEILDAARINEQAEYLRRVRVSTFGALRSTLKARNEAVLRFDRLGSNTRTTFDAATSAALESFKNTEAAYRSQMGLQAPVAYWSSKATEHKQARERAYKNTRNYFLSLILVMLIAFIFAGYVIHSLYQPNVKEPVALYVLISGSLAALSTVGFWIGRIVTKLYLSEHHLATDAEERKIMTETFLALRESGEVTDAERQIILSALFRNTSDGIVKEDGPGDISIQGLLAKLIAGGKS